MKRRTGDRPRPPASRKRSTLTARTSHSTVPSGLLDTFAKPPRRERTPERPPKHPLPSSRRVAHIVDETEPSLLDLIDNLLSKGVVLQADLILALANVDLVYVRLAALVCAADRVLPNARRGPGRSGE